MKFMRLYACPAYDSFIPSVKNVLKRGAFASEKQYQFYLNNRMCADKPESMWIKPETAPEGSELCIQLTEDFSFSQEGKRFGRKSRSRDLIIWVGAGKVLRVDKMIRRYNDKEGSSWIEGVEQGVAV